MSASQLENWMFLCNFSGPHINSRLTRRKEASKGKRSKKNTSQLESDCRDLESSGSEGPFDHEYSCSLHALKSSQSSVSGMRHQAHIAIHNVC